jgi:hypothetical protein
MEFLFQSDQIKKLAGLSSRNGIWLTDGVLEIGQKEMAFYKSHIAMILGIVMAITGFLNMALYEWWMQVFFGVSMNYFQLILFAIHVIMFDLFIAIVLFLGCSTLFMGKQTKKYHALEHKILNLMRDKKPITVRNIQKSSAIYNYCGVNIITLYLVGTAFMSFFPIVVNAAMVSIYGLQFAVLMVVFLFVFCVLIFEYNRAVFGKFFQKLLFTAKISVEEIGYGIELCRGFLRKQYGYEAVQKVKNLKLEIHSDN